MSKAPALLRRILPFFLIFALTTLASADELTPKEWQKDLDQLAQTIRKKHKNPFHRISEAEFEAQVTELRTQIPTMTPDAIRVGLVRIGALIGDGHTAVRPYSHFDVYPLKLFWFGEELRVTGAATTYAEIVGWKITKIGELEVHEAARAVDVMTPQGENSYFVKTWNGYWLKNAPVLQVLGVTSSSEQASYTFQNDAGDMHTLELEPVSNDAYDDVEWASVFQPRPPFMQPQEEAIRFEIIGDGETLYLSFRSYPSRGDTKKIAKKVREKIEQAGIKKFIVDLRGNGGGDFTKGQDLIKEIRKSKIHETGIVYALTDRWTFSAAMSNAAHFRDNLNAILVGEPPAERPNGYAENHSFTLSKSDISASCSSRYYTFQDEDTPELKLDHYIGPEFEAWAQGQDPVLEWVLAQ